MDPAHSTDAAWAARLAREQALEEAAKILDAEVERYSDSNHPAARSARHSASAIRALKTKDPA